VPPTTPPPDSTAHSLCRLSFLPPPDTCGDDGGFAALLAEVGALLMGRRTFESIGRPLPGRRSIVVSRNPAWAHEGCERAGSLDDAIARCAGARNLWPRSPSTPIKGAAWLVEIEDAMVLVQNLADESAA
jgi:hypothetical protein